jgi:DNA primase
MKEERPDLAAVLDHYGVTFNPDRTSQKILCPVHEEYVESCSVNLDEGWFNCHACGAKGDSWNLIMAKEQCDFVTAVARSEGIAKGVGNARGPERMAGTPGLFGRERPAGRAGKRTPFRPKLGRD